MDSTVNTALEKNNWKKRWRFRCTLVLLLGDLIVVPLVSAEPVETHLMMLQSLDLVKPGAQVTGFSGVWLTGLV